jgi:hypothetical protein
VVLGETWDTVRVEYTYGPDWSTDTDGQQKYTVHNTHSHKFANTLRLLYTQTLYRDTQTLYKLNDNESINLEVSEGSFKRTRVGPAVPNTGREFAVNDLGYSSICTAYEFESMRFWVKRDQLPHRFPPSLVDHRSEHQQTFHTVMLIISSSQTLSTLYEPWQILLQHLQQHEVAPTPSPTPRRC